jgi:transcriptional regulator with XRE-family HTH domain
MEDWAAYATALEGRRTKIGMTKAELARRAHVSESLIYKILKGQPISARTSARIDVALGWRSGTLWAVAHEGIDPPDDPTAPDRIIRLERDMVELRATIIELRELIEQLAARLE